MVSGVCGRILGLHQTKLLCLLFLSIFLGQYGHFHVENQNFWSLFGDLLNLDSHVNCRNC